MSLFLNKRATFTSLLKTTQALDGDLVGSAPCAKAGGKAEGEIVEVLERKRTQFVGVLKSRKIWLPHSRQKKAWPLHSRGQNEWCDMDKSKLPS